MVGLIMVMKMHYECVEFFDKKRRIKGGFFLSSCEVNDFDTKIVRGMLKI